jgi:hypothetical protein
VAANKTSAAGIRVPGGRTVFPGGGGEAAMALLQGDFVLPDLLLPRRLVSSPAQESGEKGIGDGRRREPASSRRLLPWSGKSGVKAAATVFFLDGVDGRQRGRVLRSDGEFPRPMSPKGYGAAACSSLLLRSTKELDSDGISSVLGSWLFHLPSLRRRRRRMGMDVVWWCSRSPKAPAVIFFFLGFLLQNPVCAVVWTFPELCHVCCNLQLLC